MMGGGGRGEKSVKKGINNGKPINNPIKFSIVIGVIRKFKEKSVT